MLRQKITIFWGALPIHWTGLVLDSPKLHETAVRYLIQGWGLIHGTERNGTELLKHIAELGNFDRDGPNLQLGF